MSTCTIEEIDAACQRLGVWWHNAIGCPRDRFVFGTARAASVRNFLRRLTEAKLVELMDCTLAKVPANPSYDNRAWRYFCGACWTAIEEGGR